MLVIGSLAARNSGIDIGREPADADLIATYDDIMSWVKGSGYTSLVPIDEGKKLLIKWKDRVPVLSLHHNVRILEVELAWHGTTADDLLRILDGYGTQLRYALPNTQLFLKMSHRYRKNSPHFLKTMQDIKQLREHGAVISDNEHVQALLKRREKETYTYAHPKLNVSKRDFFSDAHGVQYVFVHDDIHRAVAIEGRPAYEDFKLDGEEVKCDRAKFEALPWYRRLHAVVEESMVLAIERSLVPHPGVLTAREAYLKALEKVCTSITSGWFREFAWEQYYHASMAMPEGFHTHFWNEAAAGRVRYVVPGGSVYGA